jgi:hypothetical protein
VSYDVFRKKKIKRVRSPPDKKKMEHQKRIQELRSIYETVLNLEYLTYCQHEQEESFY